MSKINGWIDFLNPSGGSTGRHAVSWSAQSGIYINTIGSGHADINLNNERDYSAFPDKLSEAGIFHIEASGMTGVGTKGGRAVQFLQPHVLNFLQGDVGANTPVGLMSAAGFGVPNRTTAYKMPWGGSIVGLSFHRNDTTGTGALTVAVTNQGSAQFQKTLDEPGDIAWITFPVGDFRFAPNNGIGCAYSTSNAVGTADVVANVFVVFEIDIPTGSAVSGVAISR